MKEAKEADFCASNTRREDQANIQIKEHLHEFLFCHWIAIFHSVSPVYKSLKCFCTASTLHVQINEILIMTERLRDKEVFEATQGSKSYEHKPIKIPP